MKKAICLLLAIMMCISAAGCGQTTDNRSVVVNQGKTVSDVLNDGIKSDSSPRQGEDQTSVSEQQTEPVDELPSEEQQTEPIDELPSEYQTVDVDLTKLNSTMVYSEVYNMMKTPEDYMGKTVRMNGAFTYAKGENRYYFACLIADATACCAQGIEFVLKTERAFPDEYPETGEEITVVGIFDTYYEDSIRYYQLIDAYME